MTCYFCHNMQSTFVSIAKHAPCHAVGGRWILPLTVAVVAVVEAVVRRAAAVALHSHRTVDAVDVFVHNPAGRTCRTPLTDFPAV